ncbi:hypothetical protein [Neosynechococcus sphagnicola]|uniref:hypothetical protein n=1 Tax=Neosynechococcus sphagnicola TaxID=1501145 RepID=UPI0019553CC6|nr:hypothetical protein [Neosynechococcus sphagnicola]
MQTPMPSPEHLNPSKASPEAPSVLSRSPAPTLSAPSPLQTATPQPPKVEADATVPIKPAPDPSPISQPEPAILETPVPPVSQLSEPVKPVMPKTAEGFLNRFRRPPVSPTPVASPPPSPATDASEVSEVKEPASGETTPGGLAPTPELTPTATASPELSPQSPVISKPSGRKLQDYFHRTLATPSRSPAALPEVLEDLGSNLPPGEGSPPQWL